MSCLLWATFGFRFGFRLELLLDRLTRAMAGVECFEIGLQLLLTDWLLIGHNQKLISSIYR